MYRAVVIPKAKKEESAHRISFIHQPNSPIRQFKPVIRQLDA
ncbi:hypothetical protein [Flagellimonas baculiformis]|nr:hypothetical protein [Muricauda sp. D6]